MRIVFALLLAAVAVGGTQPSEPSSPHFLAFRFDDSRVIAVVKVIDDASVRRTEKGLSAAPAARFGFPYFDAPPSLRAHVPVALQSARWVVHVRPGHAVDASVERVIGGNPQCAEAAAVLLAVDPSQTAGFARVSQHYYVAEAAAKPRASGDARTSTVRDLTSFVLSDDRKRSLESLLDTLMRREAPAIRRAADAEISRLAASDVGYQRTWAAERRRLDEELSRGRVKLVYDVQAFELDPGGVTTYFVRAEWLAGGRQAFAAALWLRGDDFAIVETNVGPASWLHMFEFQNKIDRIHLGQVLNVLDRDGDGWGEIVFAHGGYESLAIEVREYSRKGFLPPEVSFTAGC